MAFYIFDYPLYMGKEVKVMIKQMYDYYIRPYLGDMKGQDLVEYALLLAIIVAIGWVIYQQAGLKESLKTIWTNAGSLAASAATETNKPTL